MNLIKVLLLLSSFFITGCVDNGDLEMRKKMTNMNLLKYCLDKYHDNNDIYRCISLQ